jgi:hypothetical protein
MGVIAEVFSYFSPEHDVKPSITLRADRIWNTGGGSTPNFVSFSVYYAIHIYGLAGCTIFSHS